MKCYICNEEVKGTKGLSVHITKKHEISKQEYYDKYISKKERPKCYFCDNDAYFISLTNGYKKICSSKECLGKTRATGTYEFLMYKYGLTEEEAKKEQEKRANNRGEKIKESFDKKYENDKDFHKKRSHNTKEFWMNKGFSEEESIKKSEEVMKMIHEKTFKKFKDNPEKYDDIRTSQLKYWLKKGYNYKKAKEKLKERQRTFTLEKCIKKYGKVKGKKIYNDRQKHWSELIEKKYQNGEFSKTSKNHFSYLEIELIENIIFKLKLKKFYSALNENQFYRRINNITYSYDFVYKNKIIEFNGDYWHCNPDFYNKNFFHKHKQMFAYEIWKYDKIKKENIENEGFVVLIIWENEYKQNKEKTIQDCIDFLKS